MDITISSLSVPAVSRNGRIYPSGNNTANSLISSAGIGSSSPEQYWTSTGGTLTPTTAGDIVYVAANNPSGYVLIGTNANATGHGVSGVASGSGAGVEGVSASGYGVNGTSTSGTAGNFSSSSGTGVKGVSASGYAGEFTGGSNRTLVITGSAGPIVDINTNTASASAVFNMLRLYRSTTGSAAAGIGSSIDFTIEQSGGSASTSALLSAILTNVSSVTSEFSWQLRNAGAALAEVMRLTGAGELWAKSSGLGTTLFTPLSTLDVIGSQSEEWRLQTGATTTLSINDRSIICDTSSNAVTVNLPNATTCSRRTYIIRRYTGSNNVTIDPYSSQTILGSTGSFSTLDLTNNGEWIMLTSNGSDWYVLASNPNF